MQVYLNKVQQLCMMIAACIEVIVGGRRLGKSAGLVALRLLRNVQVMPRGSGAIVCATFQQALTRTLPGTLAALESWGYRRGVHYYVGVKPPTSSDFPKPIVEPVSYERVISFYTGAIVYLISQDVIGSSNSLTLDWLIIDEAKFINHEKLKEETFPANGGFKGHFGHIPWHHSILITSDMPTTKKGSWFLNYKEHHDPELISTIEGLLCEIYKVKQRLAEKNPPVYLGHRLRSLYRTLGKLRSIATYYREWSAIENLAILGEAYIAQMKRDLSPLVFQTSIMCQRLGGVQGGFYQNMKEELHYYTHFDNSYLSSLGHAPTVLAKPLNCLQDGDLKPDEPICIALDYNANINWIVAGQPNSRRILRVLKSFFVKYDRKIPEVVSDFCDYYAPHRNHTVVYYYDSTAIGNNYAVSTDDFKEVVAKSFRARGWRVVMVNIGNPIRHNEKHLIINEGFMGRGHLVPLINKPNNEDLILAMENTGVYNGPNGFHKDKRGEKLAESEEEKLEHRTDGTDAFDTLYIGCDKFPHTSIYDSVGNIIGVA